MTDKRRLLLLDEDPSFLAETAKLLRANAYIVRTLLSSKRLFFFLPRFQPDLLLLDFDLLDASGTELLRRVRESSFGKNLPIVLLTSRKEPLVLTQAFEGGIDDFVRKPVFPGEFFLRLEAIFRRSPPTRFFVRLENYSPQKGLLARGLLFWRQGYLDCQEKNPRAAEVLERLSRRWLHSFRDFVLSKANTLHISDLPILAIRPDVLFVPLPEEEFDLPWISILEKQARILQRCLRQILPSGPQLPSCSIFLRFISGSQELAPESLVHSLSLALQLDASREAFCVLTI